MRDHVNDGDILLEPVDSENQLADIFTKSFELKKFLFLRNHLVVSRATILNFTNVKSTRILFFCSLCSVYFLLVKQVDPELSQGGEHLSRMKFAVWCSRVCVYIQDSRTKSFSKSLQYLSAEVLPSIVSHKAVQTKEEIFHFGGMLELGKYQHFYYSI